MRRAVAQVEVQLIGVAAVDDEPEACAHGVIEQTLTELDAAVDLGVVEP